MRSERVFSAVFLGWCVVGLALSVAGVVPLWLGLLPVTLSFAMLVAVVIIVPCKELAAKRKRRSQGGSSIQRPETPALCTSPSAPSEPPRRETIPFASRPHRVPVTFRTTPIPPPPFHTRSAEAEAGLRRVAEKAEQASKGISPPTWNPDPVMEFAHDGINIRYYVFEPRELQAVYSPPRHSTSGEPYRYPLQRRHREIAHLLGIHIRRGETLWHAWLRTMHEENGLTMGEHPDSRILDAAMVRGGPTSPYIFSHAIAWARAYEDARRRSARHRGTLPAEPNAAGPRPHEIR